jgi:hypothetical protein
MQTLLTGLRDKGTKPSARLAEHEDWKRSLGLDDKDIE